MKLLVISGFWPNEANPITGIFVVQQIAALTRAGCDVSVLVPVTIGRRSANLLHPRAAGLADGTVEFTQPGILRVPERLCSIPGATWLNANLYGTMISSSVGRLTGGNRFDACIVHGTRDGLALPSLRPHVRGNALIVLHGVDPHFELLDNAFRVRPLFEAAGAASSAVVLVGSPLFPHATRLGFPDQKLRVVPNGTDLPPQSKVSSAQRPRSQVRRVVSVSNLWACKGIDDNLRALASLFQRRPDLSWEYRIIGDGPCRSSFEALTFQLGISSRVQFLGRLPYPETMQQIGAADIFSLPSWNEAFGIVYLEAMARMRPVIGCHANGAAEIVTDRHDGVLVEPRNITAIEHALEELIRDPERSSALGQAARKTAEGFSWDHNASRILALLTAQTERERYVS